MKDGALARLAINGHCALVGLHDAVHDGEPESRPLPWGFCREERLKDSAERGRVYSMTGVADGNSHVAAGPKPWMIFGQIRVHLGGREFDFELPSCLAHGVPCVRAEIHDDLVNLAWIGVDCRQ